MMNSVRQLMLAALVFLVACASNDNAQVTGTGDPAQQSVAEIQKDITTKHPVNYITLAAKLFQQGNIDDAARWYYIGQIRYRAYLMANPNLSPSGDPALYASLQQSVGKSINQAIGRNADNWEKAAKDALQWHKANKNQFTPKQKYPQIYQKVESGIEGFISYIHNNKKLIRQQRAQNGLPND